MFCAVGNGRPNRSSYVVGALYALVFTCKTVLFWGSSETSLIHHNWECQFCGGLAGLGGLTRFALSTRILICFTDTRVE